MRSGEPHLMMLINNYMKKVFILSLIAVMSLVAFSPALANEGNEGNASSTLATSMLRAKYVRRALTIKGTITTLTGTAAPTTMVIKVTSLLPKKAKKWTGTYPVVGNDLTVNIASTSRVIRLYGAKAGLGEFQVGDEVRLVGKTNEDGTVTALVLRDNSINWLIWNRGTIDSINATNNTFVLKQPKRNLTITVTDATKISVRGVTSSTFANLQVGQKADIRGVINTRLNTVNATGVKAWTPVVKTEMHATSTVR